MTRRSSRRGWTLLLLRPDDPESHRLHLTPRGVLLVASGAALACALVGVALGRVWEASHREGRVRALEEELARLESERGRVAELADRLEGIEASYRRIRRALGGDIAPSAGDVVLPPVAAETAETERADEDGTGATAWAWPLAQRGFVTRSFAFRPGVGGHPGVDIAAPLGSYVRAAAGGVVARAGEDPVYGRYVRIAHGDGLSSLYAHNSWVFVTAGDTVERLQVIALSGSTGQSTAPHLHFEIERDGAAVDPSRFVSVGR